MNKQLTLLLLCLISLSLFAQNHTDNLCSDASVKSKWENKLLEEKKDGKFIQVYFVLDNGSAVLVCYGIPQNGSVKTGSDPVTHTDQYTSTSSYQTRYKSFDKQGNLLGGLEYKTAAKFYSPDEYLIQQLFSSDYNNPPCPYGLYENPTGKGFLFFNHKALIQFNNNLVEDWTLPYEENFKLFNKQFIKLKGKYLTYPVVNGNGKSKYSTFKMLTVNLESLKVENSVQLKDFRLWEIYGCKVYNNKTYFLAFDYEGVGSWSNYHITKGYFYEIAEDGKLLNQYEYDVTPEFEKVFFENKKITGYYKGFKIENGKVILFGETPKKVNKKFAITFSKDFKFEGVKYTDR